MTNDNNILNKITSSDLTLYAIVCAIIIGVVIESSIISVSGFDTTRISTYLTFYVCLSVFSVISQIIILKFVGAKVDKSNHSSSILQMGTIKKVTVSVQIAIIGLILGVVIQITFFQMYQTILIMGVLILSFLTATIIMGLLSWRFITWLKTNRNRLVGMYLVATIFISISGIVGTIYFVDQLRYQPNVVHPKQHADFVTYVGRGNSSLADFYVVFSALSFVFLWLGTVILLQSYRRRLGSGKYLILMSVPLLYFLSQFEPAILNFLLSFTSGNQLLFNITYIIMVDVSRPMGGLLFGLAFILAAHKLQSNQVKSYLVISGIGLLLVLISYHAHSLITTPFPPLGLLSASYFGLSSYLIFVGIYSSALSISQDAKLRYSIRKSVETEVNFLKSIGDAEKNRSIVEKVLRTSRKISTSMPDETGVSSSLTEKEIKEYVEAALSLALEKKVRRANH